MSPDILANWDLGLPLDARLIVTLVVIFIASFAKGVAGLGVPIIATPILTSMYDLQTAIVVVAVPMMVSDFPFVLRGLPYFRELRRLVPFMLFGLVGIVIGTQLLVVLPEVVLASVLGVVVTFFVVTSWFNALPLLTHRAAGIIGPPIGLIGGIIQGSSGASGPLVTMYLLSLGISRELFLFFINAIFTVLDVTQVVALQTKGLSTPGLDRLALLACVPMGAGVLLGIKTHKYINDVVFRRAILLILLLAAVNLFARVISRL